MAELMRPWEPASSSIGPPGAPMAEPVSSSGLTKEERGAQIPQTPPRTPKCYICKREASEHSICAFCQQVCCGKRRRNTECCHWWKCDQCSCHCGRPPPVSTDEQSTGGPPEAPPAESSWPEKSVPERLKTVLEDSGHRDRIAETQKATEDQNIEG